MFFSNILDQELQYFHEKISARRIIYHKNGNDPYFIEDGLKLFPLFRFNTLLSEGENVVNLDNKCIINPDDYMIFLKDSVDENIYDNDLKNNLIKNKCDSLSLNEFNYLIYYLRSTQTLIDSFTITDEQVNGEFADYIFDFESIVFTDEGVLITDVSDDIVGTVTLKNPVFSIANYTLKLTIKSYSEYNLNINDNNTLETQIVEVPLSKNNPEDISFDLAGKHNIISVNAEVIIDFKTPEIRKAYMLDFTIDDNVVVIGDDIVFNVSFSDNLRPMDDNNIVLMKEGTVIAAATTDSTGECVLSVPANELGYFTFHCETEENIISEDITVHVVNEGGTITLESSSYELTLSLLETATLTATVLNNHDQPIEGETITFLQGNTVLGSDVTDSNGIATFEYVPSSVGEYTISAQSNDATSNSITINVIMGSIVTNVTVNSSKQILSYANNESSTITALVTDQQNIPMANKTVTFKRDGNNFGSNLGTGVTNENGIATCSNAYNSFNRGDVTITAECENITSNYTIEDCKFYDKGDEDHSSSYDIANSRVLDNKTRGTVSIVNDGEKYTVAGSGFGNWCLIPFTTSKDKFEFSCIMKGFGMIGTYYAGGLFYQLDTDSNLFTRYIHTSSVNTADWSASIHQSNLAQDTEYKLVIIGEGSYFQFEIYTLDGTLIGSTNRLYYSDVDNSVSGRINKYCLGVHNSSFTIREIKFKKIP